MGGGDGAWFDPMGSGGGGGDSGGGFLDSGNKSAEKKVSCVVLMFDYFFRFLFPKTSENHFILRST